jgi:lipid-A-disaccharide synthase-like uncharacterized protein
MTTVSVIFSVRFVNRREMNKERYKRFHCPRFFFNSNKLKGVLQLPHFIQNGLGYGARAFVFGIG